jgi:hypothetical protein
MQTSPELPGLLASAVQEPCSMPGSLSLLSLLRSERGTCYLS